MAGRGSEGNKDFIDAGSILRGDVNGGKLCSGGDIDRIGGQGRACNLRGRSGGNRPLQAGQQQQPTDHTKTDMGTKRGKSYTREGRRKLA